MKVNTEMHLSGALRQNTSWKKEVILETLASLYTMARCNEELNNYNKVECPLVRRRLQTAVGNGLNNVTWERNDIGSGS